jgi:hypothetical protein
MSDGRSLLVGPSMQSLYFHFEHAAPVLRYSSSTPQIGDSISMPELGEDYVTLEVFDVVPESGDMPRVNVFLHHSPSLKIRLAR